jgi:hypothetical protein
MNYIKYIVLFIVFLNGCSVTTEQLKTVYDSKPNNKALAIGDNARFGTAWNRSTIEEAKNAALKFCVNEGGINCKIVSINGVKTYDIKTSSIAKSEKLPSSYSFEKPTDVKSEKLPSSYSFEESTETINDNLYNFTVNVRPSDSTVKIMNITPKYKPGIQLKAGKYDVLVERKGRKQWRKWIEIVNADLSVDVTLKKASKRKKVSKPKKTSKRKFGSCARKNCGSMRSCKEAYYHLRTCGNRRLDRDKDGIPCEKICL